MTFMNNKHRLLQLNCSLRYVAFIARVLMTHIKLYERNIEQ